MNDDRMQRRLLAEVELTFDKVLRICQAMESANKNVKDLKGLPTEETGQAMISVKGQIAVHKVYSSEQKVWQKEQMYYRCKGQHSPEECRFANELCRNCGRHGHIKRSCETKPVAAVVQKASHKGQRGKKTEKIVGHFS